MAKGAGSAWGSAGGKLRAAKLSPERRAEIARKAATSRWKHTTKEERAAVGKALVKARKKVKRPSSPR